MADRPALCPDRPGLTPLLIDAKAAARLLGIGERLLGLMTASGEIPSLKVRRRRLYPVESLRRWIEVRSGGGTP